MPDRPTLMFAVPPSRPRVTTVAPCAVAQSWSALVALVGGVESRRDSPTVVVSLSRHAHPRASQSAVSAQWPRRLSRLGRASVYGGATRPPGVLRTWKITL